MQSAFHHLRILVGLAFTLMLAPVVGEFFVELAKENKLYDEPTERVGTMIGMVLSITDKNWFWYTFALIGGLTIGIWLDWLARKYLKKIPESTIASDSAAFRKDKVLVRGQSFSFQVVDVDGRSFHRCNFSHVTLRYSGFGFYDFIDCKFNLPIKFEFGDERLMGAMGLVQLAQQGRVPIKFSDDPDATDEPKSPS